MWNLPRLEIEPLSPLTDRQILILCTTRELPNLLAFVIVFLCLIYVLMRQVVKIAQSSCGFVYFSLEFYFNSMYFKDVLSGVHIFKIFTLLVD